MEGFEQKKRLLKQISLVTIKLYGFHPNIINGNKTRLKNSSFLAINNYYIKRTSEYIRHRCMYDYANNYCLAKKIS